MRHHVTHATPEELLAIAAVFALWGGYLVYSMVVGKISTRASTICRADSPHAFITTWTLTVVLYLGLLAFAFVQLYPR
jgi:hypothetical protein